MIENRDFLPYNIAIRIKQAIEFSVKLDYRDPELNLDQETSIMLDDYDNMSREHSDHFYAFEESNYDYESYPALKKHKIELLETMLKRYINRKYKISFSKGMQLGIECLILLVSMVSMLLKANVFSFVYLVFIYRYFTCPSKVRLLVRMSHYIAFMFTAQYLLYILNLTSSTSP